MPGEPNPTFGKEPLSKEELLENRREELFAAFEKSGTIIDKEIFDRLVPSIKFASLKEDPLVQEYRLDKLIAKCETDGSVSLDESYAELNELQQRYILTHEFGHRLDSLFRHAKSPKYQQALTACSLIPIQEVSSYVAGLDMELPEDEDKEYKLNNEKMAELFAQFLLSDGSLGGMLRVKLTQFPGNTAEAGVWDQYQESSDLMKEIDGIDALSGEDRADFFAAHPQLVAHYHIVKSFRDLTTDRALFEENKTIEFDPEEYDYLDYEDMVVNMPEIMPSTLSQLPSQLRSRPPMPKNENPGTFTLKDFLDPFSVFRS